MLVLTLCFVSSIGSFVYAKAVSYYNFDFSTISEEESIDFVEHHNIDIPDKIENSQNLGKITSDIIKRIASDSYNAGQRYATCLLCGGLAEMGFVQWTINSSAVTKVTINGSFILPNGVVVLEDEDLDAYLNGTLVFYDKDKVPVLQ